MSEIELEYTNYITDFECPEMSYQEWLEMMYRVRTRSYDRRGKMIRQLVEDRDNYNRQVFDMLTDIKKVLLFYVGNGPTEVEMDNGCKADEVLVKYFKEYEED